MQHLSSGRRVDCPVDVRPAEVRGKEDERWSKALAPTVDQMIYGQAYGLMLIKGTFSEQVLHLAQVVLNQVRER
jgi:hypothetical protein